MPKLVEGGRGIEIKPAATFENEMDSCNDFFILVDCITECNGFKSDTVCGTNGVTYENICELFNAACRSKERFTFQGRGTCGKYVFKYLQQYMNFEYKVLKKMFLRAFPNKIPIYLTD